LAGEGEDEDDWYEKAGIGPYVVKAEIEEIYGPFDTSSRTNTVSGTNRCGRDG